MVPLSFDTHSKLERKKSTRFFFRPIRENNPNILKVFQSRILDALVCGWYPRRMENQVGPGDWKTQLRVGRYSIDLLWNLAPQDPPRNPTIIYYGQGISVYSGNYYTCVQRFGVPGRCTGFKTWPGQHSGRVRSIKPCFSIRNNQVIWPAFYAIVACHAHHQLPATNCLPHPPRLFTIPNPFVVWYIIYQISFLVIRATLPTLVARALGCRVPFGGRHGLQVRPRPPHPKLLANTTPPN